MQIVLLVEGRLHPMPQGVKVVNNWGYISIQTGDSGPFVGGDHMLLEGSQEAFKDWLKPFDGVWVGEGSPQMQQFSIMHTK